MPFRIRFTKFWTLPLGISTNPLGKLQLSVSAICSNMQFSIIFLVTFEQKRVEHSFSFPLGLFEPLYEKRKRIWYQFSISYITALILLSNVYRLCYIGLFDKLKECSLGLRGKKELGHLQCLRLLENYHTKASRTNSNHITRIGYYLHSPRHYSWLPLSILSKQYFRGRKFRK